MKVRTITAGVHLQLSTMDDRIETTSAFLHEARDRFVAEGIEVQTVRVSTQPFQTYLIDRGPEELIGAIREIDSLTRKNDVDFLSVGPASTPRFIEMAPSILARTERVNLSCFVSTPMDGVLHDCIQAAARAIMEISHLPGGGIRNFNFAALGNCPPGIPFFPAAYHQGTQGSFSIGLESGPLLNASFEMGMDLNTASEFLHEVYWKASLDVQRVAMDLQDGFRFAGIDTSVNPSTDPDGSVADAIATLIGEPFGSPGTLSACAMLTGVVKDIPVKSCGYRGLMLPVLEDTGLARASDEGGLNVSDLLTYSSVCGTGLDALPLPGNIPLSRVEGIIKDMAYLSTRLGKPLSARMLPVPGLKEGERTSFDSPYLLNCRVLPT